MSEAATGRLGRRVGASAKVTAAKAAHGKTDDAKVAEAIQSIREGREQRALGEWKIRQGIHDLDLAGWSQRKISRIAGVSQPEVSRRLKRRMLDAGKVDPRELIMQRATGEITTEEMIAGLQKLRRIGRAPTRASAFDSAAGVTGNARQLANAFREGLLSEDEYEELRKQFDRRDNRQPNDRVDMREDRRSNAGIDRRQTDSEGRRSSARVDPREDLRRRVESRAHGTRTSPKRPSSN